jgi:hypothetical protein
VKGKRIVEIDLGTTRLTNAELTALLIGPSGKVRAPAARNGRTLLIGFDEEQYRRLVG